MHTFVNDDIWLAMTGRACYKAHVMPTPSLEEQTATAGITYGRRHDIYYRSGLVLQVLGAAILAVLYPLRSPFYSVGIMLFQLGVLLSGIYLLVWMSWIKKMVLGAVLTGIPLQVYGALYAPPEFAGAVILTGIGLVCVGAAGIAGKEAYCFAYREGWILMCLFPLMIIVNLVGRESVIFNSLGFSSAFLLLLSLTGKKLKQPVSAGRCEQPARQQITDGQTSD
jgi:uncharacterized integral membrane protein